jgi:hypothetical protein
MRWHGATVTRISIVGMSRADDLVSLVSRLAVGANDRGEYCDVAGATNRNQAGGCVPE